MTEIRPIPRDAKDKDGRTMEDYEKARDIVSDEFRAEIGDVLLETTDSYLLSYGDPKQYRAYVSFAGTIFDGIFTWLSAAGKIHLDESVKASEEVIAERTERRKVAAEAAAKSATSATGSETLDDIIGRVVADADDARHADEQPFGGYI